MWLSLLEQQNCTVVQPNYRRKIEEKQFNFSNLTVYQQALFKHVLNISRVSLVMSGVIGQYASFTCVVIALEWVPSLKYHGDNSTTFIHQKLSIFAQIFVIVMTNC